MPPSLRVRFLVFLPTLLRGAPNYRGCLTDAARALRYCDDALAPAERARALLAELSVDERIRALACQAELGGLCSCHTGAVPRVGLDEYMWLTEANTQVGGACVAADRCPTTFPGPLGVAASFNRSLWARKGEVLGTELRALVNAGWHRGVAADRVGLTAFGPNVNLARDPRWGRASETAGEDPTLAGAYAAHVVRGLQAPDADGRPLALAYLKHFAGYSLEAGRRTTAQNVSAQDLAETYLAQFKLAVELGEPAGVMCSYAAIDGVPSCANARLLERTLRRAWRRDDARAGAPHVVTDCKAVSALAQPPWSAPSDAAAVAWVVNNGTDLELGSGLFNASYAAALAGGLTTEARLNASFVRSFEPLFRAGRFDPLNASAWDRIGVGALNSTAHQRVAAEAAAQGVVLLKNDGTLPLAPRRRRVAVLGPQGVTRGGLMSDYAGNDRNMQTCFNGTDYDCMQSIAEAVAAVNGAERTGRARGVDVNSTNASGIAGALERGARADVIILVLGIDKTIEAEGHDRADTALPGLQPAFASAVLGLAKPTVLVLTNGGQLAIDALATDPRVGAVVEAFNPCVPGPPALARALFGLENRWGKLPYTIYDRAFASQVAADEYSMSKPPGRTYKYYQNEPLFPFGWGLSYTTFALQCDGASPPAADEGPGRARRALFSCTVRNTGARAGDEVVQVYVTALDDVRSAAKHPVPTRSLVDFARVSLAPGASQALLFDLAEDAFSLVNASGDHVLYPGRYDVVFSRGTGEREVAVGHTVPGRNEYSE